MTSPALAKLLGPKSTEPQPMEWITLRHRLGHRRLCQSTRVGRRRRLWGALALAPRL